jgi:hypothetical protein
MVKLKQNQNVFPRVLDTLLNASLVSTLTMGGLPMPTSLNSTEVDTTRGAGQTQRWGLCMMSIDPIRGTVDRSTRILNDPRNLWLC